jgi:hypothetical protein
VAYASDMQQKLGSRLRGNDALVAHEPARE